MLDERNGYKEVQLGPKKDEIPISWKVSNLKNVAKIISGSTPSKGKEEFWNGDIVFITPTDITENGSKYISNSKEKITEEGLNSCSTHLLEPGAVLMTSRATIGEASINKIPVCTNQGFKSIVTGGELHNEYFYYYIPLIKGYLNAIGGGSTFSEINKGDTESIKIPLPPISEQKKIAEELSTVDKAIQKTEEIIERTKKLKKGMMQDLLTEGIGYEDFKEVQLGPRKETVPNNWETKKLGDIAKVKRGASPRPISADKYFGGDVGWIRISDVGNAGKFLNRTKQYLSELGVSKSVQVYPDEIIMSICATVGKPCIVKIQACIHDGIVAFKDLHQSIDINFLYYTLQKNRTRLQTKGQTGTQSNLNSGIVRCFKVLLPPLPEQKEIAEALSTVDEKIQKEKEYKEKLGKLKKGLMQDLLTGKVRVLPLLSEEEKEELKEANVPG